MMVAHWGVLVPLLLVFVVPIIIGFVYVLPDATKHGQPGWLWALATIPLGWFGLLAYLIVRAVQPPTARR